MSEHGIAAGCAPFDEEISAWLDGELDARRAEDVRAHLAACAACAARAAALRAADAELRALAAAAPAGEEARLARVRAALAQARAAGPRAVPPAAAAAPVAPAPRAPVVPVAPARRSLVSIRPRWRTPLLAAVAAAALAALLVPRLLETPIDVGTVELAEAPPAPPPAADRAAAPPAPDADARAEQRAREIAARQPTTPGHLGAKAAGAAPPTDAAEPPLAAAAPDDAQVRAALDAAGDDELALALALAELEGADEGDLALIERLDALERLAARERGGRG